MNLDLFCICDKIQQDKGKLSVIGIHYHIFSTEYPAKHPSLSIAAYARFKKEEGAKHICNIYILTPDGKKMFPNHSLSINANTDDNDAHYYSFITLEMVDITFKTRGRYTVFMNFDNKVDFVIPLNLTQTIPLVRLAIL